MSDAVRGFVQVPHALIRAGGSPTVMWVYLALVSRGGRNGVCTAARETIAADAGCSPATVKRSLSALERLGFVKVDRRPGFGNIVTVVKPRDILADAIASARGSSEEVGSERPGVGSERPGGPGHTDPQRRSTQGESLKENLKLTASGERVISEGQMTWLVDLVLMQNLVDARSTTSDPEAYIRALVATYDAADGLIKEYWQLIEHTGRESVALDVWRSGTYDLLSERGRAFVDRELGS